MKFFIDENLPAPKLCPPLRTVYTGHEFRGAEEEGLKGFLDVPLMQELRARNFDAIVTRDRNQMKESHERKAIIDSGLRWIGLRDLHLKGDAQVTVTAATLMVALRYIIEDAPSVPTSYRPKQIPHLMGQRLTITPIPPPLP